MSQPSHESIRQPDKFETSEPEKDFDEINSQQLPYPVFRNYYHVSKEVMVVEEKVNPKESFNMFAKLQEKNVKKFMYTPADGSGIKESPIEKIERLKREIKEVEDVVRSAHEEKEKNKLESIENSQDLLAEVDALSGQLQTVLKSDGFAALTKQMKIESAGAAGTFPLNAEIQKQITANLVNKLKNLKNETNEGAGEEQIVYELYYNDKRNELSKNAQFADIEKRIAAIELKVGSYNKTHEYPNLSSLIERVAKQVNMINTTETSKIEALSKKAIKLSKDLTNLIELAQQNPQNLEFEKKKIEDLYELYEKALRYGEDLPKLIERLDTLKKVHDESASITSQIESMGSQQAFITNGLQSNRELLSTVQNTWQENMQTIMKNIESIDKRMANLKL